MCRNSFYLVFVVLILCKMLTGAANAGDPTLVGWWTFDDGSGTTPLDSSDYGRHGEFVGSPEWTDGHTGGALRVSQGNYVVIPGYKGVLGTTSRTCMAWIKTTTAPGVIFGWAPVVAGAKWIVRVNDGGQLRCEVHNGFHYGTTILTDDQWHHVAVVLVDDGSPDVVETLLYVDGVLETSNADSADEPINTAEEMDVTIGQNPHATNRWFDGLLDEARIYERALSQAEIQAVMNEAGQGFPVALGPFPEDGSLYENTWANLSWRAGDFAISHDLYFGTNFDDVNDGAEGTFVSNLSAAFQVIGFPGFPAPEGLQPGTTYYWRIDEVNEAEPNSPWKGDVWSFSIPPKTAYYPDPADGAESVALDAELSWTAGFDGKLHTVYFGDNFDDIDAATGGAAQTLMTFTPPGPLELAKTYYWRVDEFDPPTTYKGDVWSFTTEGTAANPNPAKGAVDVSPTPILKWTPASLTASHEVYLGTDADAVKNATKASPEYKGSQQLGEESYDAGRLDLLTTYYWRIDEVNDTNPGSPWIGNVWDFTTGDFLVVDDFESYNDIDPPDEASNRIFDIWIDGFGTTGNGALVGNDLPPYAEQTIVHSGAQSMIYRYDNTNKTSEATLTLVYPRDWTEEGVTKLSLWFRGASGNSAERMFVALNGGAPVYHDDPAVTQTGSWTERVIDLSAFGVDLTNVNTITIGFGTKGSPAADGGTGTMYFDDIRLVR
ncbi:MAG: LamG domain-containing protein [Planctomycetota bacterium]|jgi:hypothetical protein